MTTESPLPRPLLDAVRGASSGEVAPAVHAATRARVVDAALAGPLHRAGLERWLAPLPMLAGAALVLLVMLGAGLALRRAPHAEAVARPDPSSAFTPASAMDRSTPTGVEEAVAQLRPALRTCYQQGLNQDPELQGRAVLALAIEPDGAVSKAELVEVTGLTPEVTACMRAAALAARFPPSQRGTTVRVPVSFVQHH